MSDAAVDMLMGQDGTAPQPAAPANPTPPATSAADAAQPAPAPAAPAIAKQDATAVPGTTAASASAPAAPVKSPEQLAADAESDAMKELGLEGKDPDTLDTLREKYRASSREGHSLKSDFTALDASLEKQGLKRIRQDDGSFEFVPTDKYLDDFATPKAAAIAQKLTDEEKEMAFQDVPKFVEVILKKVAATGAKPRATMKAESVSISQAEAKQVRSEFDASQGDAFKPYKTFVDAMEERGVTESFKKWMMTSRENYAEGLKMVTATVHKALAPRLAVIEAARAEQDKRKTAAQGNVMTPSQGSVHSVQGGAKSPEEQERDAIVGAKRF